MDLTDDERDLILAGLFELTITHVEDDEKRERCEALAGKLGGDADAMFFGAVPRRDRDNPHRGLIANGRQCYRLGSGVCRSGRALG